MAKDVKYATVDSLEHIKDPEWFQREPGRESPFKRLLTEIQKNEKHHGEWIPLANYGNKTTAVSTRYRLQKEHPEFGFGICKAPKTGTLVLGIYPRPETIEPEED